MINATPVGRVCEALTGAGYQRLTESIEISGLKFSFPAVFVGTGVSSDLIVVVDTAFEKEVRIIQQIEALVRSLDAVQSLRPLSIVVTGPRPTGRQLGALSRLCRVLLAADAADEEQLKNALAVLLPLKLPEGPPEAPDVDKLLQVHSEQREPLVKALVSASRHGAVEVENCFFEIVRQPFEDHGEALDS